MDGRMTRYRQAISPERTKVWTEKSPKYHQKIIQNRKVPVIYYLCKNRYLEHPHFIEVPMSSPDGLYLRDVVNRLDDLRGRGLHLKYSWSSKRSYKTGYVWHDLSEDDLIIPVNGSEYILKGSEIFEDSNSGHIDLGGSSIVAQEFRQLPEPDSAKSRDDSSSSSSRNVKGEKAFQEDEHYISDQHPDSGGISSESRLDENSGSGDTLSLVEYKDTKSSNASDASTQTEENTFTPKAEENCTQNVSEDAPRPVLQICQILQNRLALDSQNPEDYTAHGPVSPSVPSGRASLRRKSGVTDFLNKADAKTNGSFRNKEKDHLKPSSTRLQTKIPEEDVQISSNVRLKVTDMLIQLISCGSIPIKGHSFGVYQTNKPRFGSLNSPSPWYSNSIMAGGINSLSDNSRSMGLRVEDKEYLNGRLLEAKIPYKVDNVHSQNHSSRNIGRNGRQLDPAENKNETASRHFCQLSESVKSALSVRSRTSFNTDNTLRRTPCASNNTSKRITHSPVQKFPGHLDSFTFSEHDDVITTEERLSSGVRVIIHSKASLDTV